MPLRTQTQPKNRPTLIDVAQRARVSRGAVSLVLNGGESTSRVSAETRARILDAAKELNYSRNAVAGSLRQRRTNTIGFYRDSGIGKFTMIDAFTGAVITGLTAGCHRKRQDLLIHESFVSESAEEAYRELTNGKVDGIVFAPGPGHPINDLFIAGSLPAVAVADPLPGLTSVTVDDWQGSRLIAEHLAEKGHKHVLYRNEGCRLVSTTRRLNAFLDDAAQLGIRVTLGNLVERLPDFQPHEVALMQAPPSERPTAIVCWSDFVARRTIEWCREAGLRVPDNVAVVGFDGIYTPLELSYQLTTVCAPWQKTAETAVAILHDLIEGRPVPPETVLPVSLIVGDTT